MLLLKNGKILENGVLVNKDILIKDKKTYKSVYGFQNSEKLKALYNEIK